MADDISTRVKKDLESDLITSIFKEKSTEDSSSNKRRKLDCSMATIKLKIEASLVTN
jgi:hypothetical protein